jgi:hypothetical protein
MGPQPAGAGSPEVMDPAATVRAGRPRFGSASGSAKCYAGDYLGGSPKAPARLASAGGGRGDHDDASVDLGKVRRCEVLTLSSRMLLKLCFL